jgi:hypothetical protein
MPWLSRLRGVDSGPPSLTQVVATLVTVAVVLRIIDTFVDITKASNPPRHLCACGYLPAFTEPSLWAPTLVLLVVFIGTVIYAVSGGYPRMR